MGLHEGPQTIASGLPKLKAFLNGCYIEQLLLPSTLVAKVVGTSMARTQRICDFCARAQNTARFLAA